MVTQKDIAVEAGVSVSTVSLVLSGRHEGRVSAEVVERIQSIAERRGYAPNLLARGLRTRQTHTIGLISDRVASTPFAGQMLAGAQAKAWEHGYLLLLIDTGDNSALEEPAVKALLQRDVEGLIYASMYHREVKLPPLAVKTPLVVLDGRPTGVDTIDWIVPDEEGGAFTAVSALLEAGHRRIGFCNNLEQIPASSGRLAGYYAAHKAAGIPADPHLIVGSAESSASAAFPVARELLERPDRPSAVFCFSDRIAMGVYEAAAELDLRIPQDLSVVGFDNQEFVADALRPGLTTIELPHRFMGSWAVDRLISRLEMPSAPTQMSMRAPCTLVTRQSISEPCRVWFWFCF